MPGSVALAFNLDTKNLKEGDQHAHAPELCGMHYKFAIIPRDMDMDMILEFHKEVPKGKVIAAFIFGAKDIDAADQYKNEWKAIVGKELTREDEPQLVPIWDLLLAPLGTLTEQQKVLIKTSPDDFQRFQRIAKLAHEWATAMAMKAAEAWQSANKTTNTHIPEGLLQDCRDCGTAGTARQSLQG